MSTEDPIYVTKPMLPSLSEFVDGLKEIWDSHILTNMGSNHSQFSEELKKKLNVKNLELFVNGHLALEIALHSLGLEGEVITTPFSFSSTTHAIVRNGLTPVFADININNYNLNENLIESLITEKTVAILPVHVYGTPCNTTVIDSIAKQNNLFIIYDAAHAFGVQIDGVGIGNFGDISMFSFHATKVFHSIEGGALAFKNDSLKEKLKLLKNFGIAGPEEILLPGTNAKMNEFQALMGTINLKYIDEEIKNRQKIAELYTDLLSGLDGVRTLPEVEENVKRNFAYYPILIDETKYGLTRDQLANLLGEHKIFVRKYFYPLITDYQCYQTENNIDLPVASYVAERIMTLPLWGDLDLASVKRICSIIRNRK